MSMEAVIAPYLTSQWGRRAAFGAIGLASLLFLSSLIHGVSWVVTLPSSNPAAAVSTALEDKPLPNIADLHLFGLHQVAVGPSQVASLPPTTLQLTLSGLFMDANTKKSKALIAAPGHPTKAYGVGDSVPGGAIVYQILDDGVILERDGHLEKLALPIQPLKFGAPPAQLDFQQGQP